MGETTATIRNNLGDQIYITCTSGQTERKASLALELHDYKKLGGFTTIQFVIDGKNYALNTASGLYDAAGRGFYDDLYSLVSALSETKSSTFTVEIPSHDVERRFSTLNAVDALGKAPKSIVDPCS